MKKQKVDSDSTLDVLTCTRAQLIARDKQGRAIIRNNDKNVVRLFAQQLRACCANVVENIDDRGTFVGGDDDTDYIDASMSFLSRASRAAAMCAVPDPDIDDDESQTLPFDENNETVVSTIVDVLNDVLNDDEFQHCATDPFIAQFTTLLIDDDA